MIYAITNRKLISGGEEVYFKQIEKIAAAKPDGIILREKAVSYTHLNILRTALLWQKSLAVP